MVNSLKRTGRDHDGRVHYSSQRSHMNTLLFTRESKGKNYLASLGLVKNAIQEMRKSMLKQRIFTEFRTSEAAGLPNGIRRLDKRKEDSKALITVDTLVDWTEHDGQSDGVIALKEFGMIAGCDTEDAIEEGAAKIYNLITGLIPKEAS
ncbi:hypothetical protein Tco_1018547 [Tanacetum coccineum]|uniref:Uncharacterized protein n=1 Tax=Tanacetum coccineum TaxID=301880 RepID=A0ABQ5FUP7_9ASTR